MIRLLDRHWLLTTTTYGAWLPGDRRGFVSPVRDDAGKLELHNVPQTPYVADHPALEQHARLSMSGQPVLLSKQQAQVVLDQLLETARYRQWRIVTTSVMANHLHIVVSVAGDPPPENLLRDFKAYASRALNRQWAKPKSGTWWTESGSRRKLPGEAAVREGTRYVYNQTNWLVRYVDPEVPPDWLTPRKPIS